jgi:hypothetical protein
MTTIKLNVKTREEVREAKKERMPPKPLALQLRSL